MSRIGKLPVTLPAGVEVSVDASNNVTVKGPLGTLTEQISKNIKIEHIGSELRLSLASDEKGTDAQYGLARSLVHNMVEGVTKGFSKKLQIVGVGYKVEKQGKNLVMQLGYSHPVKMEDPEGITTECPKATEITVKGASKALVGNYAADIRAKRPPEPYQGKGIRYENETVRRKEGKTAK